MSAAWLPRLKAAQSFGAHHYFSNVALLVLHYFTSALLLENQSSQVYWKL
jgi:hypothetical protein